MMSISGTSGFPPFLENFPAPVLFPHEFIPTEEIRRECDYDVAVFYDIADDLMETDFFKRNYSDRYFAIYVMKGCLSCGDIEWYDREEYVPMLYTKLIRNTPENRSYFYGPEEDYSEYVEEEEITEDTSDYTYDPEWEE